MVNGTAATAKALARERIRGIFSAICMPEKADGALDEAALRANIRHCIDVIRADGIYLHGFYGNFWLLTSDERRWAMEVAADEIQGAVPIICRCAHQSMKETVALVQHAEANGADFISLLGPAYARGSSQMVYDYFAHLAEETDLGFSVFNTSQAGYVMTVEVLERLVEIPNVAAIKNAVSIEETTELRRRVGDRVVVIDPSEDDFLVNLLEFGQQAIYTGTNYLYDTAEHQPMRGYVDAALAGDATTARQRFEAMQELRDVHDRWVRRPWMDHDRCPVGTVKYWTEQVGMQGGAVRPPLPSLSADEKAVLARELDEARAKVIERR